ncbi:surfeit locus protein 1 [Phymastichus coffea]|uniref:surfeit locus protein 1 n=1 Tax=Phymastichus coffea TaxID=108790 RepID=UPI00273AB545|nr:surfeit locus protein 1 [Phymastichus coffea]
MRKHITEHHNNRKHKESNETEENFGLYGYCLLTIPIITFGLGTWQIWRRDWKLNLIKDLEARLSREPIDIPENLEQLANLDFCPMKVEGEFLYDNEFVIGPRSLIINGQGALEGKGNLISGHSFNRGYNVITPFKVKNRNLTILVNRGWLPKKYKYPNERLKCQVKGKMKIIGINRLNEKRPQFVPKNEPEKEIWHYRDIYEMAEFASTDPVYLDMVELDFKPGMPIGTQTRMNLRNEHLSYIITWYSLSAITGFYWYRIFVKKIPIF